MDDNVERIQVLRLMGGIVFNTGESHTCRLLVVHRQMREAPAILDQIRPCNLSGFSNWLHHVECPLPRAPSATEMLQWEDRDQSRSGSTRESRMRQFD
jgi:hypothetical protein